MAEIWNLSWKLDVLEELSVASSSTGIFYCEVGDWEEDPGVMVDLESIPETLGAKKEYMLDGTAVPHMAWHTYTHFV